MTILELYNNEIVELKELKIKNFNKIKDFLEEVIEDNYEDQVKKIIKKINKRFGKKIKFFRIKENDKISYLKLEDYFLQKKISYIKYIKKNLLEEPAYIRQFCAFHLPVIIKIINKEIITIIEIGLAVEVSGKDYLEIIDQKKNVNTELANELLQFLV